MSKPAPLVRIINHGTRWVRVGDYECGVEYEVTPEVAASLAIRGFVQVVAEGERLKVKGENPLANDLSL